jgi:hypothetical protein
VGEKLVAVMDSRLVITTPAADLSLLSVEERRTAAGVTGADYDTTLEAMDLLAAATIVDECNIAVGEGGEPTLLQETLTETFRNVAADYLRLARRHEITISSVTIDGVVLETSEYEVNPESGILRHLDGAFYAPWYAMTAVVVYQAGFQTVPAALKGAASSALQSIWSRSRRDPAVKAQEIDVDGLDRVRTDYWVGTVPGQADFGTLPDFVIAQLKRFRNPAVA